LEEKEKGNEETKRKTLWKKEKKWMLFRHHEMLEEIADPGEAWRGSE
tara:strand:+ start:30 stop:170 length:141 start_codon:yes stop_codon:yes gene_type:complete